MQYDIGHLDFGKLTACPCGLIRRRRLERLDATFGFGPQLQAEQFKDVRQVAGAATAVAATRAYVAKPEGWLYLHGPYGDGKTKLAAVIVNELRAKGHEVVFCVAPEMLNWLRAAYAPESGRSYEEDWGYIKAVPVLVVDDLGTEKVTPWSEERMYELFNWRYRQQLPTIITSNLAPNQLGDGRLASRFGDVMLCKVVHCGDVDVRRYKRSADAQASE